MSCSVQIYVIVEADLKKYYIYNNILVEIEGISEDLLQFRFLLAGDFIINIFY